MVLKAFKIFGYPIGTRHFRTGTNWIGTGVIYSVTGVVMICWGCEWYAVMRYLPYYNERYKIPWDDKRVFVKPQREISDYKAVD